MTTKHEDLSVENERLQLEIPEENVQQFVFDLAQRHGVRVVRTRLDQLGDIFTSLSGDDVKLDLVGETLVSLMKAKVISGKQGTKLLFNHLRERRRLGPVAH